jgi:hypothetical protein
VGQVQHFRKSDLFPSKIPKDLNRCPVKISTFPWEFFVLPPIIPHGREKSTDDTVSKDISYTDGVEIQLVNS